MIDLDILHANFKKSKTAVITPYWYEFDFSSINCWNWSHIRKDFIIN